MGIFLFRVILVIGGFIVVYIIGKPIVEQINYRFTGESVEGRVIGFRVRGNSKAILKENLGKKYRSRRPVYRYPITKNSMDSLDGYSKSLIILPWMNFELNERVTVVMKKGDPSLSHINSIGTILSGLLLLMIGIYMIKLGVTRRD